jgi:cytochrome c peroxidase
MGVTDRRRAVQRMQNQLSWRSAFPRLVIAAIMISVGACGGGSANSGGEAAPATMSAAAQLGEKLFEDKTLSVSGQQSCATCHVAAYAFAADQSAAGPDRGSPVPLGGPNMNLPGFRNAPSLMYASFTPAFFFDGDGGPNGGFFRDGRAVTLADQAVEPFTTSFEMANADAAAVIMKLQSRPYLADFTALYGAAVLNDAQLALQRMGQAIAAYESEAQEFHPFSSKYDYWQQGKATLTAQELHGLALFNDPSKGNCAACHPSTSGDGVTPPLFTDFSFDNLGLPRNGKIPSNHAASAPAYTPVNSDDGIQSYYDLGICGPLRDKTGLNLAGVCGQFKVPTLRNIAVTAPYFHNGQFPSLLEAIGFYVRRDTNPEQFYPLAADGSATKFDDLPALYGGQFLVNINEPGSDAGYFGNVNNLEIPYNRLMGDQPALDAAEINDLIAFLCTLTDGYDPANAAGEVLPAQCQAAAMSALPSSTSRTNP